MTRVELRSGGAVVVAGALASRFQVSREGERQGWCVREDAGPADRPPATGSGKESVTER